MAKEEFFLGKFVDGILYKSVHTSGSIEKLGDSMIYYYPSTNKWVKVEKEEDEP